MLKWANQGGNEKIENRKENIAETKMGKVDPISPPIPMRQADKGARGRFLVQGLEMTNHHPLTWFRSILPDLRW